MATYHCSVKVISRGKGQSAIASAAYRAGEKLHDLRTGEVQDYTRKEAIEHSEIITPDHAPAWAKDREQLWNRVEQAERRKDAQLSREVEVALPRELPAEAQRDLVRQFVRDEFTSRGMVADINIHCPKAGDGGKQPHAHIMLTLRPIEGEDFAKRKDRSWNDKDLVEGWRKGWAERVNAAYRQHGHSHQVDHRSYERQGKEQVAQVHLGPAAHAMEKRGIATERGDKNRAIDLLNRTFEQARHAFEKASKAVSSKVEKMREALKGDTLAKVGDKLNQRTLDNAAKILQERKAQREAQRRQEQQQSKGRSRSGPKRDRGGPSFGF